MFEDIREIPVETSLFWLSSRYYSSELCRWISPDSIEYLDPSSINGLNLYCYCVNNPVMYVDSSGNFLVIAFIICGIAEGAVVSVIVVLGVKNCTSEKNPLKENDKIKNSEGKKRMIYGQIFLRQLCLNIIQKVWLIVLITI